MVYTLYTPKLYCGFQYKFINSSSNSISKHIEIQSMIYNNESTIVCYFLPIGAVVAYIFDRIPPNLWRFSISGMCA